jgi:NAD(P)-dependent dehydrogenase (short-subunit alcohol dehydrogenase family)
MELEGKVAVVTGGGRGLGRATALALAEQGARVVAVARSLPEVEETARLVRRQYGVGRSMAIRANITHERDVVDAFDTVRKRWGGTDILINNAGDTGATKPLVALTLNEWQHAIDVNLTGAFLCAREALRDMTRSRWGRIVNISSGSAAAAVPAIAPYSVAKAAVEHLTRLIAVEYASSGVVAVALRPGLLDTRMQEEMRARSNDQIPSRLRSIYTAYKQKGMLVPPERAAAMIVYLCTEHVADANGRVLDASEMDVLLTR